MKRRHSLATLLRLSKNPHYKMSDDELKQLQEYREREFTARKDSAVKHDTHFSKHPTTLPEEKGRHEDSPEGTTRS